MRTDGADGQGAGAGAASVDRPGWALAALGVALWLAGAGLAAIAAPAALASAPVVSAISPNNGPAGGGSRVTINGSGFLPGSSVSFGALAATDESVRSPNSITATSPGGAETVNVTVTNAEGSSAPLPGDRFAYDPVPHGPWLGLDGNSSGAWTGAIGDFTFHHIV